MRILFDTNVLIAAFLTRGQSFDIIKDAVYKHEVFYTDFILEEFSRTVVVKFSAISPQARQLAVSVIKKYLTCGVSASVSPSVCRDPDDDQILADAVTNHIDLLFTGDKDLLVLKKHQTIHILSPNQYWDL